MGKVLDSIRAAPPLTNLPGVPRHQGGRDAIEEVNALAMQQAADLPASASPFEVLPETPKGFSFSFSLNPTERTFDFSSPHALRTQLESVEGGFKGTIHF